MLKANQIKAKALELGADCVGITQPHPVPFRKEYMSWLNKRFAGAGSLFDDHRRVLPIADDRFGYRQGDR